MAEDNPGILSGLRSLLETYAPWDENERRLVGEFLEFLNDPVQDHCSRYNTTGHVVASAWVLDTQSTSVLLTYHHRLRRWLQLGGHMEAGERPFDAAIREAREESGSSDVLPVSEEIFDVDVHLIPASDSAPVHRHFDVRYLFRASASAIVTRSHESDALGWFRLHDVETIGGSNLSMIRMANKTRMLAKDKPKTHS